jgi:hypothetical protein
MTDIPHNAGYDADGLAKTEVDHFMKCPACGRWFDMRDLCQVFEHVHDGDIDSGASPEPPHRQRPLH